MIIVGCDGSCRYIDKRRCFILYKIIKVWMGNTYMSNIEIYFKSTELILSAIGLVFVIFGWIIPYNQTKKEENKRREFELDITRRQWKKDLIDKQISNLYGPISSLLNSHADCHPKRPPVPYYPASVSHIIRPAINHYSTVLLT